MSWKDTIEPEKAPKWKETISEDPAVIGKGKSFIRGAGQGASLGFGDEAGGVGSAFSELLTTKEEDETRPLMERLKAAYQSGRDDERGLNEDARKANPKTFLGGQIFGGALPAAATAGSATVASAPVTTAAAMGGVQGLGDSSADLTEGNVKGAAIDTAWGTISAATLAALFKVAPKLASKLRDSAEKMAEKATGATRVAADKFKPGTGARLLDEDLVTFGQSPAGLAERLQAEMSKAGGNIDEAILAMEKNGITISKQDVANKLFERADKLRSDPAQAPIVKKLEQYVYDILESDGTKMSPSAAENTKRGYQALANYTDPEKTLATKHAAKTFQEEVEGAAKTAGSGISDQFKKGKEAWGFWAPVEEAASNRAKQLTQSPVGGFLDVTAAAAGAISGGGGAAVPAAIARRTLMPRASSSMAVTENMLSKGARAVGKTPQPVSNVISRVPEMVRAQSQNINIPEMGKFAPHLEKAKERGPHALAVTDYVLSQSNPEYRDMKNRTKEEEDRATSD
ncbi:MAG: hypothetical protein IPI28_18900 [Candidatus Omnitrophica bacterium]|nr:hypothetical protein [Candidatus Omnitrophota bacterium]